MTFSGEDERCRYVAALGTDIHAPSPFGDLLRKHGIILGNTDALRDMARWVQPVMRVGLPRRAFEVWRNYPVLSLEGAENCPHEDRWALDLYVDAMTGPRHRQHGEWWVHFLDDPRNPLTIEARRHELAANDPAALPAIFLHPRFNREIRPWLDYFAYWQIYPIAEILGAKKHTISALADANEIANALPAVRQFAENRICAVVEKWNRRQPTFDWLSRIRTVLGASTLDHHTWNELDTALNAVTKGSGISIEQVKLGIRDTLLVMWSEWTRWSKVPDTKFLALLRQDIQYAVFALERLTGEAVDFLDGAWYDDRQAHEWAPLIEALPREEELARRDFASNAVLYMKDYCQVVSGGGTIDEGVLQALLAKHWQTNRAVRRFVLAFHRLQRELSGEQLMASEAVIHAAERIEQFLLTTLHSERVMSHVYRQRKKVAEYPEVRKLAKDTLQTVLGRLGLCKNDVCKRAMDAAQSLMEQRAKLHDLKAQQGLPLVTPADSKTGSDWADHLVAAFVNFVIARNYAAHHDALDSELIYPSNGDASKHPGHIVVTSVLLAVVTTLQTC